MSDTEKKASDAIKDDAKVVVNDIKVMAEDLLKTVKNVLKEGNVRRITIKDKEGKVIATFPLTVGVIGAVLAPVLAAIGALSAILTECTLSIEKTA
jgi:flagellar hook assembly protein FlgD